jgi:tRNA-specific 2-thiouridylase
MRIVVAMSGGVDSSVAAALLVEQGHEVIGLSMKTHGLEGRANRACCTPDDMRDARHVAQLLGIPFYLLNYQDLFHQAVVQPFAQAYVQGETPNPCVECNEKVKFLPLLKQAQLLGAQALATGHYAQLRTTAEGDILLERAVDTHKDQSYFLYRLGQETLRYLQFPLGAMTKPEVREHAKRFGLPTAEKQESQEICFVDDRGYAATVERILGHGGKKGPFVHEDGRVLGQHQGVHHFTLGQRRGLGIAAEEPLYVTAIDAEQGVVRVGSKNALTVSECVLRDVLWTSGKAPSPDEPVCVQQRYRGQPSPAHIDMIDSTTARVVFGQPVVPGAPGQAAVVYHNGTVLGGGVIARPSRTSLPVIQRGVHA